MRLDLVERRRILLLGEVAMSLIAGIGAVMTWALIAGSASDPWADGRARWVFLLSGAWLACSTVLGTYIRPHLHRTVRSWGIAFSTAAIILAGYAMTYLFAPSGALPRIVVLAFLGAAVPASAGWRRLWAWASGHDSLRRPVLIVGAGRLGGALGSILHSHRDSGYRVVGFIDDDPRKCHPAARPIDGIRVLGPSSMLVDLVDAYGISELVLAFRANARPELVEAILTCHERGVVVTNASHLYEQTTGRLPTWHVGSNWGEILPLAHPGGRALYLASKRLVDIVGAATGLAALVLLLPFLALAIKLDSAGSIFYRQLRTGRGGRTFRLWKLRSMATDAEAEHGPRWASAEDTRVTRVGRFLRKTHVDELPQLWNVLKGEMSLVGPRPERPEMDAMLERSISFYRSRLAVKPGLAGWGAVNGSYVDEAEKAIERLEYDLYYIKHQSLWLDIQILASAARHALVLGGR
jgi:exopolysaccharide biosynthesis polyprenyl glycosylphosphotransferase